MSSMNNHFGSPSMTLVTESVDVVTAFKQLMGRVRRGIRQSVCTVINGGHELYRARTDTKLYQECLLCGYETSGWTIDRRDQRLHLVGNVHAQASSAARR